MAEYIVRQINVNRKFETVSERGDRNKFPQAETAAQRNESRQNTTRQHERRRQRRRRRMAQRFCALIIILAFCLGILTVDRMISRSAALPPKGSSQTGMKPGADSDKYLEELNLLLEHNEEAADYVAGYADREEYRNMPIDLAEDFRSGQVPLLMQWDRRWGYNAYGGSMIGLAGCGPVCLTMAYLYFTEDTDMTPREMASFAYENGYYTEAGTSWALWTEGAGKLGLCGETIALDENVMKNALKEGGLIVCSMRPGDFTTTAHFILIRGYDENGFYVNDPNRRTNSEKQWDFETLRYQIKNLWLLQLEGL